MASHKYCLKIIGLTHIGNGPYSKLSANASQPPVYEAYYYYMCYTYTYTHTKLNGMFQV